ncbi:MAG: type II toxin-antitoxin system HicA family toxin [Synergistaceae bacterium]|nr:type II toxin-antitoxin system HicA family toxin [Synergistaceae bacterium]
MNALTAHGYILVSQSGSHVKFRKDQSIIIVPNHNGKDLSYGLACVILKKAGIDPSSI